MRNKIPFQRIEVFIIDEYTLPHDHGSHNIEELGYVLSSGTIFKTSSDLFKMLDDENRVKIFWLLCHSEVQNPLNPRNRSGGPARESGRTA